MAKTSASKATDLGSNPCGDFFRVGVCQCFLFSSWSAGLWCKGLNAGMEPMSATPEAEAQPPGRRGGVTRPRLMGKMAQKR